MRIPKNAVNFKGTKDGIIALIDLSYSFNTVIKAIEKKISEREDFFRGGTIKFLPTIGTLTDLEKSEIENLLQDKFNINSEFIMKEDFEKRKIGEGKRISEKEFLIVRKILRSGQSIEFHGNVILIGDCFNKFKAEFNSFTFFINTAEAKNILKKHAIKNHIILLKGSRGIGVDELKELL